MFANVSVYNADILFASHWNNTYSTSKAIVIVRALNNIAPTISIFDRQLKYCCTIPSGK